MTEARQEMPPNSPFLAARLARRGFELTAIFLVTAAGLFLVWRASGSLFLVFAGLLFAVFLDACTRGLGRVWSVSRKWRLAAVCGALAVLLVVGVSFGGYTIARQAEQLFTTAQEQLNSLRGEPERTAPRAPATAPGGQPQAGPAQGSSRETAQTPDDGGEGGIVSVLRGFFPNASALLQSATTALGGVAGVLGNLVVLAFLGLYVAIDPGLYRGGALLLLPRDKRQRVGTVLDETAEALRWWVVGQLVTMAIIAGLTFVALLLVGMPGAFVLALITGLFAFIPYIGAFVAGALIVLVGLAQGGTMVVWAFGVYLLVQLVESYVISPLVERWSVDLSPALIIGGLVVLGSLFGIWGFILAAPLLAVLRVMILRLWVEDALGDPEGAAKALESA